MSVVRSTMFPNLQILKPAGLWQIRTFDTNLRQLYIYAKIVRHQTHACNLLSTVQGPTGNSSKKKPLVQIAKHIEKSM